MSSSSSSSSSPGPGEPAAKRARVEEASGSRGGDVSSSSSSSSQSGAPDVKGFLGNALKNMVAKLSSGEDAGTKEKAMSALESVLQNLSSSSSSSAAGAFTDEDGNRVLPDDFPDEFVAEAASNVNIFVDGLDEPVLPHFTHQVFHRDGHILGYKDLNIEIRYTQRFRLFAHAEFTGKLEENKWGEPALIDADPVQLIRNSGVCPLVDTERNFTTDRATFDRWVEEDRKAGVLEAQELETMVLPGDKSFRLRCVGQVSEDAQLRNLFCCLQAFSLWWIESSEQTQARDWRWRLYLLEQEPGIIVGFTTLFVFVNPLRKRRPYGWRICQSVVAPQFQRRGLGVFMVSAIHNHAVDDAEVFEVTVESPSFAFMRLRDRVETKLCLDHDVFDLAKQFEQGVVPRAVVEKVRGLVKITPSQVQRCYEILRFHRVNETDGDLRAFRLAVKRRLLRANVEHVQNKPKEELKENLKLLFDDLMMQFTAVLERLPSDLLNRKVIQS